MSKSVLPFSGWFSRDKQGQYGTIGIDMGRLSGVLYMADNGKEETITRFTPRFLSESSGRNRTNMWETGKSTACTNNKRVLLLPMTNTQEVRE